MQVLGELMIIDNDLKNIPLPWYHRAPLGLESETTVSVSLVKNEKRNNCDIVVSIIDPEVWSKAHRLAFVKEEESGIVDDIYKNISDNWDIILGESVTSEGGSHHLTSLICEPKIEDISAELKNQEKKFAKIGFTFTAKPVYTVVPKLEATKYSQVENGFIRNCSWIKKYIDKHYPKKGNLNFKILVAADTRLRILKFTFCNSNAVSVDIEHKDKQGTLKKITEVLSQNNDFNILSSLSSKSSVNSKYARFRLICEMQGSKPEKTIEYIQKTIDKLSKKIPHFSISIIKTHEGIEGKKLTYCKQPFDLIAQTPKLLIPHIKEYRKGFPKNKFPVFLSRRFIDNEKVNQVVDRIKKILIENDCHVVEAFPKKGDRTAADIEVKSKMWLSKAGILLINHSSKLEGSHQISFNLPHEYGFLDGQGKPILVLQEGRDITIADKWSNFQGVKPTIIPENEKALNSENKNSIDKTIISWLKEIKEDHTL